MDLILFGMQGSGKGTVARILVEKFDMEHFEAGGELRKLAAGNTPLGKKIKEIIDAGNLVSNDVMMEIVENFMEHADLSKNIVFDGIPRFIEQAETLNAVLKKYNRDFKAMVLEISEDTAVKRLTTRKICKSCSEIYPANYDKEACEKCDGELYTRADDVPESIKERIGWYKEKNLPAIELYKDKLISVDGEPPIEPVRENVIEILTPFLTK